MKLIFVLFDPGHSIILQNTGLGKIRPLACAGERAMGAYCGCENGNGLAGC